jgi:diacylglycerol kinase (ATP)
MAIPKDAQKLSSLTIRSRIKSFGFAFRGIVSLFLQEPNAKLHLLATVAVVIAGAWKDLSRSQWTAVVLAIALVWLAEALNTAVEMICDLVVGSSFHPTVKRIKDIAAAGVLIVSIAAAVVGVLVFF